MIEMWTDGSANPNPGPGGFAVLDGEGKPLVVRSSEGRETTNIRMEGWALIAAMLYAKGRPCEIYTDSQLWINILTKWAPGWEARRWKKKGGEIKNLDLVKKAYALYRQGDVTLHHVYGHVGTRLNELADEMANKGRKGTLRV
ncbi:ribonuclease HI [Candidatus Saccharibacteria bacterium]|nr:ribonuclease HI [Candidatus Saccharibacteria bacterium]